jgi:signal transduction histidine kinase
MGFGDSAELTGVEQQLDSLRAQLDQAQRMAMIGELTSTTTHEFNNLLMTILNYAKLGLRHKDEPTRDKAFQRILDSANRATKITGRTGQFESTALRPIIEDTLLLLEREFRKYRIQLETKLDDVPEVLANASQVQRVIVNLLVNARQATAEGGLVRITLQADSAASEVVLTIRDSGSGISAEVLPRIFDPYFTTKSGPDASGKGGTGIGLASCKEIIDANR